MCLLNGKCQLLALKRKLEAALYDQRFSRSER